jgi:hypothetical protein
MLNPRLATKTEIQRTNGPFQSPYEPQSGLIFKSDREFVVLIVEIDSECGGDIVELLSLNSEGNAARYYPKRDFLAYRGGGGNEASDIALRRYIEKTYLPEGKFRVARGKSQYYVVLAGKKPLNRPCAIEGEFSINGNSCPLKLVSD